MTIDDINLALERARDEDNAEYRVILEHTKRVENKKQYNQKPRLKTKTWEKLNGMEWEIYDYLVTIGWLSKREKRLRQRFPDEIYGSDWSDERTKARLHRARCDMAKTIYLRTRYEHGRTL